MWKKFEEGSSPYDTPDYRLSDDNVHYVVFNKSTGKINSESFLKGFAEGVRYVHSNKPILIIIIRITS